MDEKILIPKEEFEKLKASFDRLSEECNLREQAEEKLKAISSDLEKHNLAEEQLQLMIDSQGAILNNAAYMVISTDSMGTITTFNPAAEHALGYTSEECVGKLTPVAFHDPDELAERARLFSAELGIPIEPGFEVFAAKARLKQPNEYEWTYIRKDGSRFPVLLSVTALCGPQGNIIGFIGIANDISGRKQSEEMLRASEAKFSTVFQQSPIALSITSLKDQIFVDVNESFLRNVGYEREELVGQPANILDLWTDHEKRDDFRRIMAEQGKVDNYEFEFQGKKGKHGYGLISATIMEINNEPYVLSQIAIITERKTMEEALTKSEARLNEAQHIAHIGSWELDIVNDNLMWSDEIFRIFEIDPEKFGASYEAFLNAIHPEDRDLVNQAYIDSLKDKAPYDIVHRLQMPDGRIKYVNEKCETYHSEEGKPLRSVGTVHDITEIKQAEELMHKREEEFRTLAENIPDHIIRYDVNCRAIYLNHQQEQERYSVSSLIGTIPMDHEFAVPLEIRNYQAKLQRVIRTGEPEEMEINLSELTGINNVFEVNFLAERNACGEIIGAMAIGHDITESKRAAEEIRDLYNNAPCGYHSLNKDGVIVQINDTELTWLGYQREEVTGKMNYADLFTPDSLKIFQENFPQFKATGAVRDLEFELICKDGSILPVLVSGTTITDKDGNYLMSRSTVYDITERKQVVEALRESEERYRMVFENSPVPIWEEDFSGVKALFDDLKKDGVADIEAYFVRHPETIQKCADQVKIVDVNKAALALHGAVSKEELFAGLANTFTQESFDTFRQELICLWYGGTEMTIDAIVRTLAGERRNVTVYFSVCPGYGESLSKVLVSLTNITERKRTEVALRESEEKYRTLIQKIQTAVVVHGADTQIITSNPKAQELLGLTEDQLLGKTVIDPAWHFFLEDGTTAPLEKYPVSQVLATRNSLRNYVLGVHRPDKEYDVWVLVNADPVFGKEGEITQVIVTFIDITERKQAEEELKKYRDDLEALVTERTKQLQESEFYYRRLFETMFQGVVYQDAEGKVISMNPAAELIFGKTQSELIGKSSVYSGTQISKEDGSQFPGAEHPAMVALATGHEVRDVVMKLYDPRENKYRWISINAMPLFHQNETKPYQVYTLFNDITESKVAEEALRVSEERMRLFFERQLVGMAITSPEKGWIKVNDKICEMLGYSREELTRLTWSEMTYPEDLAPDVAQFEGLLQGEIDGYTLEKRFVRKDGSIVFTNLLVGCVRRPDRSVDYVLAILENISGRKQADDQIRQLNEQLAVRARSLEQANKELEAFSYSVSHDLRAPLRGIDGFSQILLDEYQDMVDEQGKNYLRRVRFATQRMAQLIDDMLNLSRVSRAEINMKQVDLSEIAISIANELHENQPEREVEFIIQQGIKVKGDSHLLRIVLVNLIRNSWKFTSKHAKARIEFGIQTQNDRSVYFIRDDGAGFDMNYAQKLFGAFQRLHSIDEFPGTGIGLATVQRVIHRHGGNVWAEGEVEKGATIYFTIAK